MAVAACLAVVIALSPVFVGAPKAHAAEPGHNVADVTVRATAERASAGAVLRVGVAKSVRAVMGRPVVDQSVPAASYDVSGVPASWVEGQAQAFSVTRDLLYDDLGRLTSDVLATSGGAVTAGYSRVSASLCKWRGLIGAPAEAGFLEGHDHDRDSAN